MIDTSFSARCGGQWNAGAGKRGKRMKEVWYEIQERRAYASKPLPGIAGAHDALLYRRNPGSGASFREYSCLRPLFPVAPAADLSGQLEAHFNQMAEQLDEHLAREKILAEQNARLEQRARLSRDLHDSVKQQVFALAVQVELARSLLDQDAAAAREHLGFADELSYQVQQELTTLIHALRPADLQTKGLTAALRDYVTTWSRQSRIAADLSLPPTCCLPSVVEEALWRVTQEALSNVARHSQASKVRLHLAWTERQVTFSLADNGQGFDPRAVQQKGIGLRSMRERMEQIAGTIQIHSERSQGTRIVACCPLAYEGTVLSESAD